jgi:hypothetical protein
VDVSIEVFDRPVDDGRVVVLEKGFEHMVGCIELVDDFDIERSRDVAIPGGTGVDLSNWRVDGERQGGLAERKAWTELHFGGFDDERCV